MTLHFSQIVFTLGRTFTCHLFPSGTPEQFSGGSGRTGPDISLNRCRTHMEANFLSA